MVLVGLNIIKTLNDVAAVNGITLTVPEAS